MQLNELLPCGLSLRIVRIGPEALTHANQYLWSLENPTSVLASGYCDAYRTALVCVRWALTSCLTRSTEAAGRVIGDALRGAP